MGVPTNEKWIALSLVAVVLPISLLVTLRLTGILPEPCMHAPLETITVEPASWQMDRPSGHVYVNERIENNYTSHEVSARIGAYVTSYQENSRSIPFAYGHTGRDGVIFTPYVNLTFTHVLVESILIKFRLLEANASIFILSSHEESIYVFNPPLKEYNTSVTDIKWYAENLDTAFIKAQALRSPCGLQTQVYWIFHDENDQGHQLEVTLEIMYLDRTTHQKITVPIILAVPIQPD